MSRSKELIFNTTIIGIGRISTQLVSFFLLPLYTSILTTEEYGTYDLFVTISTFLIPVITLLMEESMFRFLIDCKNDNEKKEIISQTVIYTTVSTIIFSIIIFIISRFINIPYCNLFILYLISSILVGVRNALTRGLGRIKLYSISNFITSFMNIILNIVFIAWLRKGVAGLLLANIITNFITSIIILIKLQVHKFISIRLYNKNKMKEMIKYSVPLVPNSVSWTIINLSDRLVITSMLGSAENGVYSISNKFPNLMNTIYSFFYMAWKESAAKTLQDNDTDKFYNNVYRCLKDFMWAIVVGMISVMPFVFNLIIKNDFIEAYLYIPILVVAMYFSNISGFFGGIFSAYKDTKIMGSTTIVSAVLNLVINIALIKFIGIWAAAISTLVSTLVVYLYRKAKIKKYIILEENKRNFILSWIALFIATIIYYIDNLPLRIVLLIVIILYCVIINKVILKSVYDFLKAKFFNK